MFHTLHLKHLFILFISSLLYARVCVDMEVLEVCQSRTNRSCLYFLALSLCPAVMPQLSTTDEPKSHHRGTMGTANGGF